MASFQVDTGRLESVVSDLSRITAALENALSDADDAVGRMHQQWGGEAAEAHLSSHEVWVVDAERMRAALTQMRGVLETAQANYESAGVANTRMWS